MKKDSTSAALFSLALSLGVTGALLALIRWLGTRGFEELAGSVFQSNPSSILAIFFGVYCGSMIFYVAARKRRFPDHFRLLLFYCCFPVGIGLAGSILGGELNQASTPFFNAEENPGTLEQLTDQAEYQNRKRWHPFFIGALASLINLMALITVYRAKALKRAKA